MNRFEHNFLFILVTENDFILIVKQQLSFMVCLNLINSIKSEKYPEFNNVMKKVLDKHMNMTNLDISMEKLTEIINNRNVGNKETSIHNLDKLTKEIKSNYVKSQNVKEKARQHYKI